VREPRARRSPLEGGGGPRARRNPLEGARALERGGPRSRGAPRWAVLVGRGGHRGVGCAVCVCFVLCLCFVFFAGFKQDSPGFLGDPRGCPRHLCIPLTLGRVGI
jgi:hypothetical protein